VLQVEPGWLSPMRRLRSSTCMAGRLTRPSGHTVALAGRASPSISILTYVASRNARCGETMDYAAEGDPIHDSG
jgi:hypothetical protein